MSLFAAIIFGLLGFGVVSWLLDLRKRDQSRPRRQPFGETPFSGQNRQNSDWSGRRPAPEVDVARYCAELGVKQPFSREQLQQAYRRKISEYHPDKMHNLGQDIQDLALQKTVAINEAYEKLQAYAKS